MIGVFLWGGITMGKMQDTQYDVIIIGAGPGGIFSAYQLVKKRPDLKIAVFESGNPLEKRKCPIDGKKGKKLHKMQAVRDHERLWRSRRFL